MKTFKIQFFVLFIHFISPFFVNAQIIQTIAGGIGEGALPSNFAIESPGALVIDKKGNVYFYEELYNQIKKIDALTGRIKTVVGTGVIGMAGENDSATKAEITRVSEMAVDSVGNLYFSEYNNNRIRKVNMVTGILTTVAGTGIQAYTIDGKLAKDYAIGLVRGIAFDKLGNMYFLEATNNIIRKVDRNTGLLVTIAGTGASVGALGDGGLATAATLNYPTSILIDDSSNIYVSEFNRFRVRKISALTGIITTVVGNGLQGYTGDNGLATMAKINSIGSMTFDASGNLIIGDVNQYIIRKINKQTGIITTIAGSGIGGYGGDGGLALNAVLRDPISMDKDSLGNILFCDSYNHRIRKINASTGIINTIVGNGTQNYSGDGFSAIYAQNLGPGGIAIDSLKNLYITNSHRICKIDAQTGIITTIGGTGVGGYFGDDGLATSAKLANPSRIVIDKTGNIIFVDYSNYRIRKINVATQIITTIAGTGSNGYDGDNGLAIAAQIGDVTGIAIDSADNLYLAQNGRIRKINASTGIISIFAGGNIGGFSGDGGLVSAALFKSPSIVRVDLKGNIYIYDSENSRIRKVDAITGIIQTVLGGGTNGITEGSKALDISYFHGNILEIDANQNLYISISRSATIYKVDSKTGIISKYAGTGVAGFSGDGNEPTQAKISADVQSLQFDKLGNAWLVDKNRIRAISLTLPTILSQPKNVVACINSKTSFSIIASCDSSYQWQIKNGSNFVNILNNSIFSGAQTNTLSISIQDNSLNNNSFRCVVNGPIGITNSNSVLLSILPAQSIPEITGPANTCQDQTSVYTVPSVANHSYLWSLKYATFLGSNTKNYSSPFFGSGNQDTVYLMDAIDGTSCSVTITFPVKLFPKPNPAFTYTQAGGKLTFFPTQTNLAAFSWVINKVTSNDKNPKLQFTKNGTYSVFLKVTDSLGCYSDNTLNITVNTVGLNETLFSNSTVKLYPNPTNDYSVLAFNDNSNSHDVTILDLAGKTIRTYNNYELATLKIERNELKAGVYFVNVVNSNNQSATMKLLIQE